jgi:hypothetical protein
VAEKWICRKVDLPEKGSVAGKWLRTRKVALWNSANVDLQWGQFAAHTVSL